MTPDLISTLRLHGRLQAGELAGLLGVSRATLMRAVGAAGPQVLVRGRARRTTYAARRSLRGSMAPLPLYRVGLDGHPQEIARIDLTHPDGCALHFQGDFGWPLDETMAQGWFDGLPYPLQDMRPQGFLGRRFARHHASLLQVSEDPTLWSDDDALHALSLLGSDMPGDLILGEAACRLWLAQVQATRIGSAPPALPDDALDEAYPRLAEQALGAGLPESSAGGEFPKFTAVRQRAGATGPAPVLVKFSGSDASPGSQRWADLLVCEHLAGQVVRDELGIQSAISNVVSTGRRTFLEVQRFDRHGLVGRSGLVSWAALNGAFFGLAGRPWAEGARQLVQRGWLVAADAARIERLGHFGQLIGNTDMHDGNLSFQHETTRAGPGLRLAPVYDMLPMMYAPTRGLELPQRTFSPKLPLPAERETWQAAAVAARRFWQLAADDPRIGQEFRRLCAENAGVVDKLL